MMAVMPAFGVSSVAAGTNVAIYGIADVACVSERGGTAGGGAQLVNSAILLSSLACAATIPAWLWLLRQV